MGHAIELLSYMKLRQKINVYISVCVCVCVCVYVCVCVWVWVGGWVLYGIESLATLGFG